MNKKILLLEDDIVLNETIVSYFEDLDANFEIIPTYDGYSAQELIYENNFDLLLLDVNVPQLNGFELLKEIRLNNVTTPAIFITSLNSVLDLENAYESGCDDYIRKPFVLKELLLRVETILKREFFHQKDDIIEISKGISYHTNSNLLNINNKNIQLNNKDSKLLKLFLQHQNQLITHETIYATLWEYDEVFSESALRTYIKNLRKYLGKEKIVSIKKSGYRFTTK